MCRFQELCVRVFLRMICARASGYHCCPRTPRARTFAFNLMLWLCFLLTRRTTVRLNRSR